MDSARESVSGPVFYGVLLPCLVILLLQHSVYLYLEKWRRLEIKNRGHTLALDLGDRRPPSAPSYEESAESFADAFGLLDKDSKIGLYKL